MTPELCKAYDDALASAASQVTNARSDYLSMAIDLEQQLPNISWFVSGGCNLNDSLASSPTTCAHSGLAAHGEFATTLSGLRKP